MTERNESVGVDRLIAELTADAKPVKRLRAPSIRAFEWLIVVGAIALAAIGAFADLRVFVARASDPRLAVELAATLITGIFAVIAAFQLSMPDRPRRWMWLPLPPFLVWIAASGYQCYRNWIIQGPNGWEIGESADCLQFILLTGIPVAIALLIALRRALPLDPLRVAMVGGLGVAAISAFVLQFFHPFDVTVMDLAVHLVAIAVVVGVAGLAERIADVRSAGEARLG
ncbi:MAG: NrsF family protein [Gemmatimonas sp.]